MVIVSLEIGGKYYNVSNIEQARKVPKYLKSIVKYLPFITVHNNGPLLQDGAFCRKRSNYLGHSIEGTECKWRCTSGSPSDCWQGNNEDWQHAYLDAYPNMAVIHLYYCSWAYVNMYDQNWNHRANILLWSLAKSEALAWLLSGMKATTTWDPEQAWNKVKDHFPRGFLWRSNTIVYHDKWSSIKILCSGRSMPYTLN